MSLVDRLSDRVIVGGRPSLGSLSSLGVDWIYTLLRDVEFTPGDFRLSVYRSGLYWEWRPLSSFVRHRPEYGRLFVYASLGLVRIVDNGERVYLHCSAGLHRSGIVVYGAYRFAGLTHGGSVDRVYVHRSAARGQMGDKLEWARGLWDQYLEV